MADISITPGNVVASASANQQQGTAGETITAGMVVYYKSSDQRWWKAQADGTATESGNGTQYGIALCGASAGQPITVATADTGGISIGGTTVAGTIYCVSATAGGICPWADLVSTNYVTIIGVGQTSNKIVTVGAGNTGIIHA